jgi:hypothetical protein
MSLPAYRGIAAGSIQLMTSEFSSRDNKQEGSISTLGIILILVFGISFLAICAIAIVDCTLRRARYAGQRSRRPLWPGAWTMNRDRSREPIRHRQQAYSISFSALLGKLRGPADKAEVPDVEMQRSPLHLRPQAGRLSRSLRTETRSTRTRVPRTSSRRTVAIPSYGVRSRGIETNPAISQEDMPNWLGYRDSRYATSSLSLNHSIRTLPSITSVPARLPVNRVPSPSIPGRLNTPPPTYDQHHSDEVVYDNFVDVPESARQPPNYEAGGLSSPSPLLHRELSNLPGITITLLSSRL